MSHLDRKALVSAVVGLVIALVTVCSVLPNSRH
jgi:hypothetical protein